MSMLTLTLCGSTKFKKEFEQCNKELSLLGFVVFSLPLFSQTDGVQLTESDLILLKKIHYQKISLSDGIFVVNPNGYIGEATKQEIEYAQSLGKMVYYLNES